MEEENWKPIRDFEGYYERFKTLGAKRYMVQKDGKVNITVSGLNKKIAVPYLQQKFGDNIFRYSCISSFRFFMYLFIFTYVPSF